MSSFGIHAGQFIYEGQPVQIISGAIHYFRIMPAYWEDRLLKLKACGFNTVETYIPWNLHEPKEGVYSFEGISNVVEFIDIANKLGLFVIIRPSPYICAEWEFGGLPAWLLEDSNMRLRCLYRPFLDKVDAYYDVLLPKLRPLLCTNGGPIIAMQIENEYGSYGNDTLYLEYLKQGMIDRGIDVLLFTSDGGADHMLQGGSLFSEVLATVNFGSRPEGSFAKLAEYQPDKPMMCMEYWNGWFDHWGEEHHVRGYEGVADELNRMLQAGASVNFYMFHGGTNFGFYNGANYFHQYEPTVTSYDYDALLDESGEITDKYLAIQKVISRYIDLPSVTLPEPIQKRSYGTVRMTEQAKLFDQLDQLSEPVLRTCPETMEQLGQDYGFIFYKTKVSGPRPKSKIVLQDVHDRALIYLDDIYQGVIDRNNHDHSLEIQDHDIAVEIPEQGATLGVLVENQGRINYGWMLKDPKGITEGVRLERQFLYHWEIHTLPLDDLSNLAFEQIQECDTPVPTFYKGLFQVDEVADTFLKLEGWTKGVVFLNGFNLGRYWSKGPQKTLYVPAPLLHAGENELIIFELHHTLDPIVTFEKHAELG
ncbi:beta-galactosidase family protein [Paenibacillus sp. Marseille-Q4541]|uniref:glycoside hydrolase family 35 protein n=1 Tax=Paenibacillus sp. Marseille-Q4541 TaxID=2831522 RepID=UPI001BA5BD62|nr:beta-galactosidase family protein [Paenibacillus sp. Marseille-Q4541]